MPWIWRACTWRLGPLNQVAQLFGQRCDGVLEFGARGIDGRLSPARAIFLQLPGALERVAQ